MEEITWKQALFLEKELKTLRKEWKLNIPEEYIKSSWKLAVSFGIWNLILGIGIGYLLGMI